MTHPINDRKFVDDARDYQTVKTLVKGYGLRAVADALAQAAEELHAEGEVVKDGYGDPMEEGDIRTAAANLREYLY